MREIKLPHRQRGFWFLIGLLASALAGAAVASAKKTPKIGDPTAPEKPPEPAVAKAPSAADARTGVAGAGQSGGAPGIAQTMLTGAGGVDPNKLTLGKSTLLGG